MRLTVAQWEALEVLAAQRHMYGEGFVGGWKRRSKIVAASTGQQARLARVNYLAAGRLVKMGLVECRMGGYSGAGHSDRYRITEAGVAALGGDRG